MPELPSTLYQQEAPKAFRAPDPFRFLFGACACLAAALTAATFSFARSMHFHSGLFGASPPPPAVAGAFGSLAPALSLAGLLGGGALALAGGRRWLRLALGAGGGLVLLAGVFYVYSRAQVYPPFAIGVWAFQWHAEPVMQPLFYRAGAVAAGASAFAAAVLYLLFGGSPAWDTSSAHGSARWSEGEHFERGPLLSGASAWRRAARRAFGRLRKGLRALPLPRLPALLSQSARLVLPPIALANGPQGALSGFPVGQRGGRICYDDSGVHQYVCAPTRAGKGVGFAVPTLLTYAGSTVVLDLKRELWPVTARRRAELCDGRVFRFDPFGERTFAYNPMDLIATRGPRAALAADDAKMIAEMCVIKTGQERNPFFIDSAQQLFTGLVLWQAYRCDDWTEEAEAREALARRYDYCGRARPARTLPAAWGLLAQSDEHLKETLRVMSAHPNQTVAAVGAQFADMHDKTFSNVLGTAKQETFFLGSPVMERALSETDVSFGSLKREPASVYLILPSERLPTYKRYLRLLVTCAQTELMRKTGAPEEKVLFLLDEFPRLGRFDRVEEGISLHSGHGLQYVVITQSPAQMEEYYGKIAANFSANMQNRIYWAANDPDTAKLISREAGQATVAVKSASRSRSRSYARSASSSQGVTDSIREQARPLVTPAEAQRLPSTHAFVFSRGEDPTVMRRLNYLENAYFEGLYDPHPEHCDSAEKLARARGRRAGALGALGRKTPHAEASSPGKNAARRSPFSPAEKAGAPPPESPAADRGAAFRAGEKEPAEGKPPPSGSERETTAPEQTGPEQTGPEQTGPEQTGSEQTHSDDRGNEPGYEEASPFPNVTERPEGPKPGQTPTPPRGPVLSP